MSTDLLLTLGLAFVIVVAVVALYLRWRDASPDERRAMLADAVERLVEAAEELYPETGSGALKFGWVMRRLQRRFPAVDWEELGGYIEAAVLRLKTRQALHRNGVTRDA